MPKYSEDFKNKIASEYFDTEITQSELSKKYCVSQSSVFKWIEKYKNNSKDLALIKKSKTKSKYTTTFKLKIIQEYIVSGCMQKEIEIKYDLKKGTLSNWFKQFINEIGDESLCLRPKKRTFSKEFKQRVLKEYIDEECKCKTLMKKYDIPSRSDISKWYMDYVRKVGDYSKIAPKRGNYSFEYKMRVVKLYLEGNFSYQSLADYLNMSDRSTIRLWVIKFLRYGTSALKPKVKRKDDKEWLNPKVKKEN